MRIILIVFLYLMNVKTYAQGQENIKSQKTFYEYPNLLSEILAKSNCWGDSILLGFSSNKNTPIYAYCFNKRGTKKALIIAGVHGTEWGGIETAMALKDSLLKITDTIFKWQVVIIPELFSDNKETAKKHFDSTKSTISLIGRYTILPSRANYTDPNRQMPYPNELFKPENPIDARKRKIENENKYLLQLVQTWLPDRIASLHSIVKDSSTGIFADPRTNENNIAIGFSEDEKLAIGIAKSVRRLGGIAIGNKRKNKKGFIEWVAIYNDDPEIAVAGKTQERSYVRNMKEKKNEYERGVSFGTWASSAILKNGIVVKPASIMLTIELPNFRSINKSTQEVNIKAYSQALLEHFLSTF